MKVSNLDIQPNKTFRWRKLQLDPFAAMRALRHKGTSESVLITPGSVKINPRPVHFPKWVDLVTYKDPEEVIPKRLSRWAWITGDNPFIILTSSGNPFPFPDHPDKALGYEEAHTIYNTAVQAALHSKGIGAATTDNGMVAQVMLAGICVLASIITAAALLPRILERF